MAADVQQAGDDDRVRLRRRRRPPSDPPFAFTEEFQVEQTLASTRTSSAPRASSARWWNSDFLTAQWMPASTATMPMFTPTPAEDGGARPPQLPQRPRCASSTRSASLRWPRSLSFLLSARTARRPAAPSPHPLRAAATGRSVRPGRAAARGAPPPSSESAGGSSTPRRCPTPACVRSAAPAVTKGRCSNRSEHTHAPLALLSVAGTAGAADGRQGGDARDASVDAAAEASRRRRRRRLRLGRPTTRRRPVTEDARFSGVIDPWPTPRRRAGARRSFALQPTRAAVRRATTMARCRRWARRMCGGDSVLVAVSSSKNHNSRHGRRLAPVALGPSASTPTTPSTRASRPQLVQIAAVSIDSVSFEHRVVRQLPDRPYTPESLLTAAMSGSARSSQRRGRATTSASHSRRSWPRCESAAPMSIFFTTSPAVPPPVRAGYVIGG